MAGENPIEKLKQDPKQLAKIGVLVVVVLLIGYEVMGMFGGSSKAPASTPAPVAESKMTAAAPPTTTASSASAPATTMASAAPSGPALQPSEQPEAAGNGTPKPGPVMANAELLKLQKETEEKYLTAVNELQMLKVQQAIAETNQAIATAKLATVTSEKNITEVLTKPSGASTESTYANSLVNPVASGQPLPNMPSPATIGGPKTPPLPATPVVPDAQYIVLSVSQQQGRWTAVMGLNNKLFTATVGDALSDLSVVKNINKDGVILEKDKKIRVIQMSNMI